MVRSESWREQGGEKEMGDSCDSASEHFFHCSCFFYESNSLELPVGRSWLPIFTARKVEKITALTLVVLWLRGCRSEGKRSECSCVTANTTPIEYLHRPLSSCHFIFCLRMHIAHVKHRIGLINFFNLALVIVVFTHIHILVL